MFDFADFPTLTTPRLQLRQLRDSDADAVMVMRSDYAVTRYNIGAAYTDLSQAEDLLADIRLDYEACLTVRWGITLSPADTVVGMVGYNYWRRGDYRASVGFDLAQAYWRQGIMREALDAVLRFGFEAMQLNRIEADCSAANAASRALLLRAGFQAEGCLHEQYYEDGGFHDLLLFALLRRDWQAR